MIDTIEFLLHTVYIRYFSVCANAEHRIEVIQEVIKIEKPQYEKPRDWLTNQMETVTSNLIT